eukprot:TRINITY_DN16240_c0_g1_i2.p1 TRINITY_DN16240_c0_g1~~TRINITY_DN16240_c0_g1_i2.p1  ORF type:complete len:317 (-),score=47.57 TRINITY_DN16240_c0_g1_i2:140-1090(-)
MIRRPPRSTQGVSSAASDVYKRQYQRRVHGILKFPMEDSKGVIGSAVGISTDILRGKPRVKKVEAWPGASGNAAMYKVLDADGMVSYVIKQYIKLKNQDALDIKERAKKEKEISDILCLKTPYVGQVLDVISEEGSMKVGGPVYVTTEVLLKYGGVDLMSYRSQVTVDKALLYDVLYQSAIAIATAHQNGIFHSDIKPESMFYDGKTLKLIDFDPSSKINSESLINKYKFQAKSRLIGCTKIYRPPELEYYESVRGRFPITLGKIDSYCWGLSMLQFLTGCNDKELKELTSSLKRSLVECCLRLKKDYKYQNQGIR